MPNNERIICQECGEVVEETTRTQDGTEVCESCLDENYYLCDDCEDYVEEVHEVRGYYGRSRYVCDHCLESSYTRCDSCNDIVANNATYSDEYITVCDRCYENEYFYCDDCGNLTHEDDAYHTDDGDYCENCRPRVYSYNYEVDPIFNGECSENEYYGIELEIDGSGYSGVREIMQVGNQGHQQMEGHIYPKYDGSLNNGFEIVSHPCTYDYHLNKLPWEEILKTAEYEGYESHDAGTCGLHIHISRKAFGEDEDQDTNIMKLLYIFERFWDKILRFSRRTESQVNEWARRYGIYDPQALLRVARDSGRYHAINLNNRHTVEIRIFRGTLNYNTFIATLQFTRVLVHLSKKLELPDVVVLSWEEVLDECKQYKELMEYLDSLGLTGVRTRLYDFYHEYGLMA